MEGVERGQPVKSLQVVLRWAIGALFVYAGVMKLGDPAAFAVDIRHYRILPHPGAVALALYLPWLEVVTGACMAAGKWSRGALIILGALMVLFTGALLSAWVRGLDISCGCFGTANATAGYPIHLFRDVVILGAIGWLFSAEVCRRK
jgi:uncharacterized membrane protein YphA (DoxX/SURF4 family)